MLHKIIRKYVKYSRIILFCLNEKSLAQNCFAPQEERFLWQARQKAQEYRLCIPSIFNAACREKILPEAVVSLT